MPKMEVNLEHVVQRLDMLIKLVATGLLAEKNQREQIQTLSKAGMAPKEIAEMIGTTANTVRVELVAIKKKKKTTRRKKKE